MGDFIVRLDSPLIDPGKRCMNFRVLNSKKLKVVGEVTAVNHLNHLPLWVSGFVAHEDIQQHVLSIMCTGKRH